MKRLTKTYKDGTHGASDDLPFGEDSYNYKNLLMEKLGEYEDLKEQGRLIKLPCKIGEKVYNITWWDDVQEKVKVAGKTYYRTVHKHKVSKSTFGYTDIEEIGKTVFLTKSEAKARLKELRCNND